MTLSIDRQRVSAALETARSDLLAEQTAAGHWVGELSSSPLSTATAISALIIAEQSGSLEQHGRKADQLFDADQIFQSDLSELIVQSLHWLACQQNDDGGWGDTNKSRSNIAATMLVVAAFHLTGVPAKYSGLLERAEGYIRQGGGVAALRKRYGRDKTLAAAILTNCALADLVPWKEVPSLPFELAVLRQPWHRPLRLPAVGYTIPALVAIGQAVYHHRRPWNPMTRAVRRLSRARALNVVERLQPESGGFLESTPLTSFVVMSLASIGLAEGRIVRRGVEFLLGSVRGDGSWPATANLAVTNTVLAMHALGRWGSDQVPSPEEGSRVQGTEGRRQGTGNREQRWTRADRTNLRSVPGAAARAHGAEPTTAAQRYPPVDWLLKCQHTAPNPYPGTSPGGWAWTDLSGGVPDVDSTAGALVALADAYEWSDPAVRQRIELAAKLGTRWLLDLQNRDGGWPTFSRRDQPTVGAHLRWAPTYGRCPGCLLYDGSASDLTAHALIAISACRRRIPRAVHGKDIQLRLDGAVERAMAYLQDQQREDGSWIPLWFGNQDNPDDENPVYGTSRVLMALADLGYASSDMARRGCDWLGRVQHASGGWGPTNLRSAGTRQPVLPGAGSVAATATSPPRRVPPPKHDAKDFDVHSTGPSVEETALAVTALLRIGDTSASQQRAAEQGLAWLVEAVENGRHTEPAPIGFYFVKLWYYERLYPRIFAAEALDVANSALSTAERIRSHHLASPLHPASF